jgi:hypothetical protein
MYKKQLKIAKVVMAQDQNKESVGIITDKMHLYMLFHRKLSPHCLKIRCKMHAICDYPC